MPATAVTPSGVRDGDPAALAGLCERRGPAVLAYCRLVAGDEAAAAAAAEAFAEFRVAVVAADDPADLNPEAVLINATRHAAVRHAGRRATGVCADVPRLLAARADRSISVTELERLEVHLLTCVPCRGPVASFHAAERAYRDPPQGSVAPQDAAVIVAALTAAAPVSEAYAEPAPVAVAQAAGEPPAAEPAPVRALEEPPPVETAAVHAPDEPPPDEIETSPLTAATAIQTAGDAPPPPADVAPVADADPPPAELPALTAAARNGAGHLAAAHDDPPVVDTPTTEYRTIDDLHFDAAPDAGAGAAEPAAIPDTARRRRRAAGAAGAALGALRAGRARAAASRPKPAASSRAARATHLPRPQRARPAGTGAASGRGLLRPSVALPAGLVALALLVALFVAGVFGAGDPSSRPGTAAPAVPVPPTTTAEIVVVPGAREASAAAVERAKARARAKRKRAAKLDSTSPTPVVAPAPAAAGAAPAQGTPAPAQRPAANGGGRAPSGSGATGIDADNGATGAEQLPPSKDTSTVPELAPPTDPAAPPG